MTTASHLGPYQVLGRIGVGGMAQVFAVVHPRTREQRAIKVVLLTGPGHRARFLREARLQRRVDHDNVLRVLNVLDLDGYPALVLPLVHGPTLDRLLREAPPPVGQRLALFREIVAGVAAIHAAGLVHRDLKPANVLLDAGGPVLGVRVADFGVAKALAADAENLTRAGVAIGTPAYIAPEQQADAASADARADVWALGRILGKLLGPDSASVERVWTELAEQMVQLAPADRPADAGAVLWRLPPTEALGEPLREICARLAPTLEDASDAIAPTTLIPAADIPRHLVAERDAFIGRKAELLALAELLASGARLVTVLGPPGVGKTRLAARYAAQWLDDHPGGAWFCDLSDARDADGMVAAVAVAMDVQIGGGDPATRVGEAIVGRGRCLVVLDNFEQLVGRAEGVVERWLDRAEDARFLVTSRTRLGMAGEEGFDLPPMHREDAIALFQRRAAAVGRDVATTDEGLGDLMSLLDGLPLAIELAAARSALLAPATLLRRMDERFMLLAGRGKRRDRHATLRGTIDWSWELLDDTERSALAQLSVFEGGFTLDAAVAVLALDGAWPLDIVQALVDKSLVRGVEGGRFGMLVSIQAYAREKLGEIGGTAEAEVRHGRYHASLATDDELHRLRMPGGGQVWWSWWAERDNLLAAIDRAIDREDAAVAGPCAVAMYYVLERRGPFAFAAALFERVLAVPVLPAEQAASLALGAAEARQRLGDRPGAGAHLEAALGHYDAAIAERRAIGDRREEGVHLGNRAMVMARQGRTAEATDGYREALAIAREVGNRWSEGNLLGNLGYLLSKGVDSDETRELLEASLAIHRELGNRREEVFVRGNLGVQHAWRGRMDQARVEFETTLAIHIAEGNRWGEGNTRSNLATLHGVLGRGDEAREQFAATIAIWREVGNAVEEGTARGCMGDLEVNDGHLVEARLQYEAALAIARRLRHTAGEASATCGLGIVLLREGRWDEARAQFEAAVALALAVDDRRTHGVALGWLAEGYVGAGDRDRARTHLDEGVALLRTLGDEINRARLLCVQVTLELAVGDVDAARVTVDEVRRLVTGIGAGSGSELGRRLTALTGRLG